MARLVLLNGTISSEDVRGSLPSRDDRPYWKLDGSAVVVDQAAKVAARRGAASLTRAQFLKACVAASIITAEVAEEAATGKWPAAFDAFLGGLTSDQRIEAKATWADGGSVRRDNEILALIAADQGVSDAQLDTMFGIG